MKRTFVLLLSLLALAPIFAQHARLDRIHRVDPLPGNLGRDIRYERNSTASPVMPLTVPGNRSILKVPMSSSLNVNGIFVYEERFVTLDQASGLFSYGNRAGGVFGNTGNDLKFKFMWNGAPAWDSVVVNPSAGRNYRYPSMVVYNPTNSTSPDDIYGIMSGPIYETAWTNQYFGSIRLDGQNLDMNYQANEPNTYLNHMHIDLYCSPDGHVTVASQRMNGTESNYTYEGWEILNGTFNPATHTFDWITPFQKLRTPLKEEGRIDANHVVWSPDGSIGYLFGTAVDSNAAWNPYGIEWPVIFKSTDHGITWTKAPAFDFSTIPVFQQYLYPMRSDTTKIIPRWYNKWASEQNQRQNGATVDMYGNLHIFAMMRSTMSLHPDSLNYFYSNEPMQLFDVYMKPGGGWDAFFIDTLLAVNPPDPGTYGIDWDHQLQMSRTADGSKVFCAWTDTDPQFAGENVAPDIKAMGYDVISGKATMVKDFTGGTICWLENWWMRLADEVYYDPATHTSMLPFTTSTPGNTNEDPLVHQYLSGCEISDYEFSIPVGQKELSGEVPGPVVSPVRPNPCHDLCTLKITLGKSSVVIAKMVSITGQTVRSIDFGSMTAGKHTVTLDATGLTPGLYFHTVLIDGKAYSGKVVVN